MPVIILIILSVIIGLIIDRISRDRVIKIFHDDWVVLFYEDMDKNGRREAYFGKINIPPRSGGGFELEYNIKTIVNPEKLIGYLKRAYSETGDEKYLRKARDIYETLYKASKIGKKFDDIKYDPFREPSEVSRKIYKDNIKDIYAIVRFIDDLDPDRLKKRAEELNKVFHPPFLRRMRRSIVNFLGLAKDRISDALGVITSTITKKAPVTVDKEVSKARQAVVSTALGSYEALLETSIGKMVMIKVIDIDGVERYYQGILREYSPNYIILYNVDFRIDEEAVYLGDKLLENYPVEKLDYHGWTLEEDMHLKIENLRIEDDGLKFRLRNIYHDHVYINKILVNGSDEAEISDHNLEPNEIVDIVCRDVKTGKPEIKIDYTIIKKSDVIWPASKARVIGSSEPS